MQTNRLQAVVFPIVFVLVSLGPMSLTIYLDIDFVIGYPDIDTKGFVMRMVLRRPEFLLIPNVIACPA